MTENRVNTDNNNCDTETKVCSPDQSVVNKLDLGIDNSHTGSKLTYYFDPLCGWCFGFSPVMEQVQKHFGGIIDIEVVSGGLFLGNRAGSVNSVAPHIKAGAYKSVEQRTGVKFGAAFLQDVFGEGKMILDSVQPSLALIIVSEKFPEKSLEFAGTLLKAVYVDGMNPIDLDSYNPYIAAIGMDIIEFQEKMKDPKYLETLDIEYKKFRNSAHSGMPSLVLNVDGKELPISYGYTDYSQVKATLSAHLQ